jgi:agmatine/peptidylarginine deiminase
MLRTAASPKMLPGGKEMAMTSVKARENKVRRYLRRKGLRLVKLRQSELWYKEYGPYLIVNQQSGDVSEYALTLSELESRS